MSQEPSAREAFLSLSSAFKPKAVDVPVEGGTKSFFIRPMTLAGLTQFQKLLIKEPERAPAIMLIDCLCDSEGKRLFKSEDEKLLADIPHPIVEVLVEKIGEISGVKQVKGKDDPSGN